VGAALKIDPASKKALEGLATALIEAEDYESVISRLRSARTMRTCPSIWPTRTQAGKVR